MSTLEILRQSFGEPITRTETVEPETDLCIVGDAVSMVHIEPQTDDGAFFIEENDASGLMSHATALDLVIESGLNYGFDR